MLMTLDPPYAQEALELGLDAARIISAFVLAAMLPVIGAAFLFAAAMFWSPR